MGAFRQKKERAPRCIGTIFAFSWSRLMPQMGPQKMSQTIILKLFLMFRGSHSRSNSVEEAPSQTSATLHGSAISPKTYKKSISFSTKNDALNGAVLRPEDVEAKIMTTQSGRQRAPEAFTKNVYFPTVFTSFALRDPFGGRSRGALHFQKKQKSIGFITFRMPRLDPTQGSQRNIWD